MSRHMIWIGWQQGCKHVSRIRLLHCWGLCEPDKQENVYNQWWYWLCTLSLLTFLDLSHSHLLTHSSLCTLVLFWKQPKQHEYLTTKVKVIIFQPKKLSSMNFKRITMAKDLILLVVTKLIRLQLRQLPVTFWSNCQPVGFFFKRRRISGCHWFRRTSDNQWQPETRLRSQAIKGV